MLHRAFGMHAFVPGPNGKTIDEHFGRASSGTDGYSVAHMFAPAGWHEPAQVADFDEVVMLVSGQLAIETEAGTAIVRPGESAQVAAGTRVRFRNASAAVPCEYWSLCVPAWRPDRVRIAAE